ncbi:glycoside hydrolase family 5 protein [Paraferrimonas sp. SM1919]|uniref:glycoside hydrolase family 5 protein n=1 Tax=Paraferrimonas sp. SM1919 TaxID=2662263 RepID=UPI0013D7B0A3|nr:glycoside hydrolase family 5 protein [Paraferrimonas sp. SM1919]
MKIKFLITSSLLMLLLSAIYSWFSRTAVEQFGQLSISDGKLVTADAEVVQLVGPSFFWSNTGWSGADFYTAETVAYFSNQWKINVIRAAIGVEHYGGYKALPEDNFSRLQAVVDAAIEQGIYVIIDWHSHHAHLEPELAVDFFQKVARLYGDKPNVLYEIYNEPLDDASWQRDVKPYAEQVIAAIRQIDPDNIIIVGSPTWSQDVDQVAQAPITSADNIAYSLHFYAASHGEPLRQKAKLAINAGLALFITEWGTIDASGDGEIDYDSTEQWLAFIDEHQLSHCGWSISNKLEAASFFKPEVNPQQPLDSKMLTKNGRYFKSILDGK